MRSPLSGARSLAGGHAGLPLSSLLDDLRHHREKQKQTEEMKLISKRGVFVFVLLLCFWFWLRSGSGGGGYGEKRMHCFFLLDSTGSMSSLRTSVVTGFNSFLLTQQKQPGSMLMTLARFNSFAPFDLRFDARDVHQVAPLDRSGFEPSGQTPLYDALGALIEHAAVSEKSSEREVVIAVFTDGMENASRKYSREAVFKMIEQRRQAGWTFVFLGANQDSFASSTALAMSRGATSNYIADARGVTAAWADLSGATARSRKVLRSGKVQSAEAKADYLKGFDSAQRDFTRRKGGNAKRGRRDRRMRQQPIEES